MSKNSTNSIVLEKGLKGLVFPIFLGYLVFLLLPGIDSFFLSRISDESVAGVALVKRILAVILVISSIVVFGAQSRASHYMGENDYRSVHSVLLISIALMLLITLPLAFACRFFVQELIALFGPDPVVGENAEKFLFIMSIAIPMIALCTALMMVANVFGQPHWSMISSLILLVANVIFNSFVIYGWLGFPQYGLEGVAWASVLSVFLALLPLLYAAVFKFKILSRIEWKWNVFLLQVKGIFKIGLPSFFEPFWVQVTWVYFSYLLLKISAIALAVASYVEAIFELSAILVMAIAQATHTIVVQRLGRKEGYLAHQQLLQSINYAVVSSCALAGLALVFWREALSIFTQNQEVIAIALPVFIFSFLQMPFRGANTILSVILTGIGDGWYVALNSALSHLVFGVFLALILFKFTSLGIASVYVALLVNEIARTLINSLRWYSNAIWLNNSVENKIAASGVL